MNLTALADFVTVIRHGGFGKAARRTNRPKPTLSRRVRDLEEELGVRLLDRGGVAIRLTDEGILLYERAHRLLAEFDDLAEAVTAEAMAPRGHLRISAPVLFASTFLGKIAAEFTRVHPQVLLEVIAEDRPVDLVEEGYHAVIRANPSPTSDLVGRCFARDEMLVVAPTSTVQPSDPEQEVPAVAFNYQPEDSIWRYSVGKTAKKVKVRIGLQLSSMLMVRGAVLAGAGVAILPRSLAQNDLNSGKLSLWGIAEKPAAELWVLYQSRRFESSRLRAFVRCLEQSFPNGNIPVS